MLDTTHLSTLYAMLYVILHTLLHCTQWYTRYCILVYTIRNVRLDTTHFVILLDPSFFV